MAPLDLRTSRLAILCMAVIVFTSIFTYSLASAVPILESPFDLGQYKEFGTSDANNLNYFVGNLGPSGLLERGRDFFVFNITTFASDPLKTATLAIFNPANGFNTLGSSPQEIFTLHDVTTPIGQLTAEHKPGAGMRPDIYQDLGSGALYGSKNVSIADNGRFVRVDLTPTAINDINQAAKNGNTHFAFGGDLTGAFAGLFPNSAPEQGGQVRLEGFSSSGSAAPEPSTMLLLGSGVAGLISWRRKQQINHGGC